MNTGSELAVTLSAELYKHLRAEARRLKLPLEWLVASMVGSAVGTTALLGGGPAQAATQSDASLLLPILGAELLAAFAYEQVIDASVFSSHGQRVARRVLAQERLHVAALSTELRRLDGTPPKPLSCRRRQKRPRQLPMSRPAKREQKRPCHSAASPSSSREIACAFTTPTTRCMKAALTFQW